MYHVWEFILVKLVISFQYRVLWKAEMHCYVPVTETLQSDR